MSQSEALGLWDLVVRGVAIEGALYAILAVFSVLFWKGGKSRRPK